MQKPNRKADAARLEAAITEWKMARRAAGLPSTVRALGEMCGGLSQSAVSQYSRGIIPLNIHALSLFSNALNVYPEDISPGLARSLYAFRASEFMANMSASGMIYTLGEFIEVVNTFGEECLPDVFSLEIDQDCELSLIHRGEVVTVSRKEMPRSGDVVMAKLADGTLGFHIYRSGRQKDFYCVDEAGTMLHSRRDGVQVLFSVVGMPTLRLSTMLSRLFARAVY